MVADVGLSDRTWEVHPELSFAQLSGLPALAAKKSAAKKAAAKSDDKADEKQAKEAKPKAEPTKGEPQPK